MSFSSCVLICSALLGALAGVRGELRLGGEKPEDLAKFLAVGMPMPCQELGEVLCLHNDNVTSGRFAKSSALHLNLTSYVEPFSLSFLLVSLFVFFLVIHASHRRLCAGLVAKDPVLVLDVDGYSFFSVEARSCAIESLEVRQNVANASLAHLDVNSSVLRKLVVTGNNAVVHNCAVSVHAADLELCCGSGSGSDSACEDGGVARLCERECERDTQLPFVAVPATEKCDCCTGPDTDVCCECWAAMNAECQVCARDDGSVSEDSTAANNSDAMDANMDESAPGTATGDLAATTGGGEPSPSTLLAVVVPIAVLVIVLILVALVMIYVRNKAKEISSYRSLSSASSGSGGEQPSKRSQIYGSAPAGLRTENEYDSPASALAGAHPGYTTVPPKEMESARDDDVNYTVFPEQPSRIPDH